MLNSQNNVDKFMQMFQMLKEVIADKQKQQHDSEKSYDLRTKHESKQYTYNLRKMSDATQASS